MDKKEKKKFTKSITFWVFFIVLSVIVFFISLFGLPVIFLLLIMESFKGNEHFETTKEEVIYFEETHLSKENNTVEKAFKEFEAQWGIEIELLTMEIDEENSFRNSVYLEDAGGRDTQREVIVNAAYRVKKSETSSIPLSFCTQCTYEGVATFSYENGTYKLDTFELPDEMFAFAFNETINDTFNKTQEKENSMYYYQYDNVYEDQPYHYMEFDQNPYYKPFLFTLPFHELSESGKWDKKENSFRFTPSKKQDLTLLQQGIVQGYLHKKTNTPKQNRNDSDVVRATMELKENTLLFSYYEPGNNQEKKLFKKLLVKE